MVMNTQFFYDYNSSSSLNNSSKNSTSINSVGSNTTSRLFDTDKSSSSISNNKNFNEVLKLEKHSQVNDRNYRDKQSLEKTDKDSKVDKLKSKIKELKEDVEDGKCDEKKASDILEELLSALNNLLGKNDISESLSNADKQIDILEQLSSIDSDGNSMLQQLLQAISGEDSNSASDLLKDMKQLLEQLSASLNDDSNENMNNGISDIISRLDEMLENSNNQGKAVSAEELSNHNSNEENDDNSAGMADKRSDSKEDKFLNSLLDDNSDSIDNKINLFAGRTQSVQGQNGEVRGLTVNKATFADDLIKDVKFMSTNNIKELTVKVNPGNLGEITIKLVQEDGLMKANLKANSKETTALLSQNLAEIKKELGDQNIKIAEVNIELYNEDTTFFKNESFGGQLSQEQSNSKSSSQNNTNVNAENSDIEEVEKDNLSILENSLDFLA
ncbi:MAG: flagellar hook-length control protein FliK [Clostridium sp.]|nr:flagellar hook-length control protein FliK [Clostridium sp.]